MNKKPNNSRRNFLKTASGAIVTLQIAPFILKAAHADEPCESELKVLSGPSAYAPLPGHFHYLNIPTEVFRNPPQEGIKLYTTLAYLHCHLVVLSQEQLIIISQGQNIIVEDSVKDHHYSIQLLGPVCFGTNDKVNSVVLKS